MNATFYTFTKRENSTATPTGTGSEYSIVLKDPCSVISPEISLNLGMVTNPTTYNYCYIPEFGRYYFVRNWYFNRGLWTALLEVDVLATWKTEIGASQEYVARAAYDYDSDVTDNMYALTGEIVTDIETFASLFQYAGQSPYTQGMYIVGVIGKSDVTYYIFPPANFENFMDALYSTAYADSIMRNSGLSPNEVLTGANPMQYITSIRWYPIGYNFDPNNFIYSIPVGWGTVTLDNVTGGAYKLEEAYIEDIHDITLPNHPQYARGRYLNRGAFTSRTLFYPPFGLVPIPSEDVAYSAKVRVIVRVDYRSGTGYLTALARNVNGNTETDGAILAFVSAVCSSDCLRAGITSNEWGTYRTMQAGLNIVGQAAQVAGNAIGAFSGISQEVSSVGTKVAKDIGASASTLGQALQVGGDLMGTLGQAAVDRLPILSTHGSDGAIAGFVGTPQLISIFNLVVPDDRAQLGRPLCDRRTLSSLPGFIAVAGPDISIPGTAEENRAIKEYLSAGFFYE